MLVWHALPIFAVDRPRRRALWYAVPNSAGKTTRCRTGRPGADGVPVVFGLVEYNAGPPARVAMGAQLRAETDAPQQEEQRASVRYPPGHSPNLHRLDAQVRGRLHLELHSQHLGEYQPQ